MTAALNLHTEAAPAGLHVHLISTGPTLRFALWFESYPDPLAFKDSPGFGSRDAHPHPGCIDERPAWLPEAVAERAFEVELKSLANGFPIALPGPMMAWDITALRTQGRAIAERRFTVTGWVLPPTLSLGPLRHLLLEWQERLGDGFIAPSAARVVAFIDEVLAMLRDRPLLPALSLPPDAWEKRHDGFGPAWPHASQPLAWVPAVSLDELEHLTADLEATPHLHGEEPDRYPARFARFLVELFDAARSGGYAPPPASPWSEDRLAEALFLGEPSLVELHRAHGSCLHPHHPVFRPPMLPPGHLEGRLNPAGPGSPPTHPLRVDLGVADGDAWLSLAELVRRDGTRRTVIEHEDRVWFRPASVIFRDWSAMAAADRALFCKPELLAEGRARLTEAGAQRMLEQGPQLGDRRDLSAFLELEGVEPYQHRARKFTRFSVAPGHTGAVHVRLRWALLGDPEAAGTAFGNLRFAPNLTLALGDKEITLEEAEELLRATPGPILHARGVVMHRAALEDALEIARARQKVLGKLVKEDGGGLRWQHLVEIEDQFAPDVDEDACELLFAEQWSKFLARLENGAGVRELEVPKGFLGTLRPYQLRGLSWLWFLVEHGLGACLADDMGLGKTVQLLALLCERKATAAAGQPPSLVVCPTSVVTNWAREAQKFAPELTFYVHQGHRRATDLEGFVARTGEHDVTVTSFTLARRDQPLLLAREWDLAVVDEAQNIKNPDAIQTRVIKDLRTRGRIALTGTPIENRLRDLWSIFAFLDPGLLGGPTRFSRAFATPIRAGKDTALDRLHRRVGPFLLRRTKRDPEIAKDLPDKQEQDVLCELTREQTGLYRAMAEAAMKGLEDMTGIRRKSHILTALLRLKQICNHPETFERERPDDLFGRSGKLDRLGELLEELLAEHQPALIFTQFTDMADRLHRAIEQRFDVEAPVFHGGLVPAERDRMVQSFQSDDGPPVLILSLRAGGAGLNLTRASVVIHFDHWWNPAVEDQATDRAHRIGQKQRVNVYRLVTRGTIEERIQVMLEDKRLLANKVLAGADDRWLTELDDAELQELMTLDDPTSDAEDDR